MRLKSVAAAVIRAEPILLAVVALPLLFPTPGRSLALLALPLLWLARRCATGHFVPRTPLDASMLLLLVMVLVSLYATFDIAFSLPKITGLLLGVAVFYAVVAAASSRQRLDWALAALFVVGSGVAALGLIGTRWIFKQPLLSDITRRLPAVLLNLPGAEGGFHPNQVAGTLLWFVPLQVLILARARPVRALPRLLLAASLALTGGTLLLTQSRSGWLGLLIALLFMAAVVWRPMRWVVGLLVLAGIIVFVVSGPTAVGEWLFGASEVQAVTGTLNLSFRLNVWRVALWGAGDFAFTGMGLGTFRRVARLLYPLPVPADYDIAHAHNHFLQTAVDLGLAGLVAYMALWMGAAFLVVRTYRVAQDDRWRTLALGLGAGMLAYFFYGLTDAVALGAKPGVVMWLVFGLVVAVHRLATRAEGDAL